MTSTGEWELLDPTVEPGLTRAVIAPRPETMDGKVLGLLANGKPNSEALLHLVQEILADRYQFKGVVARTKASNSRPCPQALLEELVKKCDIVITASGD